MKNYPQIPQITKTRARMLKRSVTREVEVRTSTRILVSGREPIAFIG